MKPICVKCARFYRPLKNGVFFREGMSNTLQRADPGIENDDQWRDYKLWCGDLWHCLGCGHQLIVGVPTKPVAEHYDPHFAEWVSQWGAMFRVNDC